MPYNVTIRNRWLDYVLRGTTPAALAMTSNQCKVKLHTADPGASGTTAEVTGGSYVSQNATFSAASSGSSALSADVPFTGMPATTVTHISIWDTAGTPLFLGGFALTTSKTVGAGDTFTLTASGTSGSVT